MPAKPVRKVDLQTSRSCASCKRTRNWVRSGSTPRSNSSASTSVRAPAVGFSPGTGDCMAYRHRRGAADRRRCPLGPADGISTGRSTSGIWTIARRRADLLHLDFRELQSGDPGERDFAPAGPDRLSDRLVRRHPPTWSPRGVGQRQRGGLSGQPSATDLCCPGDHQAGNRAAPTLAVVISRPSSTSSAGWPTGISPGPRVGRNFGCSTIAGSSTSTTRRTGRTASGRTDVTAPPRCWAGSADGQCRWKSCSGSSTPPVWAEAQPQPATCGSGIGACMGRGLADDPVAVWLVR